MQSLVAITQSNLSLKELIIRAREQYFIPDHEFITKDFLIKVLTGKIEAPLNKFDSTNYHAKIGITDAGCFMALCELHGNIKLASNATGIEINSLPPAVYTLMLIGKICSVSDHRHHLLVLLEQRTVDTGKSMMDVASFKNSKQQEIEAVDKIVNRYNKFGEIWEAMMEFEKVLDEIEGCRSKIADQLNENAINNVLQESSFVGFYKLK